MPSSAARAHRAKLTHPADHAAGALHRTDVHVAGCDLDHVPQPGGHCALAGGVVALFAGAAGDRVRRVGVTSGSGSGAIVGGSSGSSNGGSGGSDGSANDSEGSNALTQHTTVCTVG